MRSDEDGARFEMAMVDARRMEKWWSVAGDCLLMNQTPTNSRDDRFLAHFLRKRRERSRDSCLNWTELEESSTQSLQTACKVHEALSSSLIV